MRHAHAALVIASLEMGVAGATPVRAESDGPNRGVAFTPGATALWIGDVAGGTRTGGVLNTLGTLGWSADVGALSNASWPGMTLGGSLLWIRGRSVTNEFVGDAFVASNVDGYDAVRLFTAWTEQGWAGHGSVRLGILAADEEFAGNEFGGALTNSAFGWPTFIAFNAVNGGPIYSVGAPGVRLDANLSERWNVRGGVFDGDALDSPNGSPTVSRHGLHWQLTPEQGAFAIAEVTRRTTGPLARIVKGGVWWHSARFEDTRFDASGVPFAVSGQPPREHRGNGGAWWTGAADLARQERAGGASLLSGWLRVGASPGDRSAVSWGADAGIQWTGIVPGRDADALVVGIGHASVSHAVVEAERDAQALASERGILPDFERVIEGTYRMQVHPRLGVAPGVQWIQHPGMSGALANAWVPSLRVSFQ